MNTSNIFKQGDVSMADKPCSVQHKSEGRPRERFEFGKIYAVPTDRICPNPSQPRYTFSQEAIARLADSIRKYGILQPLSVRCLGDRALPLPERIKSGVFELIAGERRLRAAKLIGLTEVPCVFVNADNRQSAELALIENLQREDLNLFEQAGAIAALIDIYHMTQEQVAQQLSCSQSYVANKLRILRLTPPERKLILDFGLTERHARALLKISSPDVRIDTLKIIIAKGLNVAQSELYVEKLLCAAGEKPVPKQKRKLIIKDIRLFYNTIDKAIDTITRAGINVEREKLELPNEIELRIRIPKSGS